MKTDYYVQSSLHMYEIGCFVDLELSIRHVPDLIVHTYSTSSEDSIGTSNVQNGYLSAKLWHFVHSIGLLCTCAPCKLPADVLRTCFGTRRYIMSCACCAMLCFQVAKYHWIFPIWKRLLHNETPITSPLRSRTVAWVWQVRGTSEDRTWLFMGRFSCDLDRYLSCTLAVVF